VIGQYDECKQGELLKKLSFSLEIFAFLIRFGIIANEHSLITEKGDDIMDFENMAMKTIWDELGKVFSQNPEPLGNSTVTYAFELEGEDGGGYGLKLENGRAEMLYESPENFDCKLKMSDENFKKLLAGNLNTTAAFMMGRIKVEGKLGYALKLESIIKQYEF